MKLLKGIDRHERQYQEMLASDADIGQQHVAIVLPDNVMARYRKPRTKDSEDWEGFSGRC